MFNIKCSHALCDYIDKDNTSEFLCQAMTGNAEGRSQFLYIKLCEGGFASQMSSLTVDD